MFLPSYPKYDRIQNVDAHRCYLVADGVYVSPIRRVKCRVRVLAARRTPKACSGSEYCGIDVFVAHGMAVTPYYWHERWGGRFYGAFITDNSLSDKHADVHMREGYLPESIVLGDEAYRDCTHMHIITAHAPKWRLPQPNSILALDMMFVNVHAMPGGGDDDSVQLTSGSSEFGTKQCPFVLPTAYLSELKSFDAR